MGSLSAHTAQNVARATLFDGQIVAKSMTSLNFKKIHPKKFKLAPAGEKNGKAICAILEC